jgi:hypothetical protein
MTKAGPGVDRVGNPVVDPTKNVLDKVGDAILRLDDLASLRAEHTKEMLDLRAVERDTAVSHIKETADLRATLEERIASLRASHAAQLAEKETDRLDAIRAVDRDAVTRAAEASAAQASVLAAQVQASAEQVRGQVEQTRIQFAATLGAALEPIQKDVADLRRVQYEQAGQQGATTPISEQLAPLLKEIASLRADQLEVSRAQTTQTTQKQQWGTSTSILIIGIVLSLFVGIGGIIVGTGALTSPGKDVTVLPDCKTAPVGAACTSIR